MTPKLRLPAKPSARFFDFTEQPGPLHFAQRRQLGQDGLTPPVERRNLLAAREHRLVHDDERVLERSLRVLLGKTPIQLCDDHAFPRKRTA